MASTRLYNRGMRHALSTLFLASLASTAFAWPTNSVRYARMALERIRGGQRFSTFGWDEAPAEQAVA